MTKARLNFMLAGATGRSLSVYVSASLSVNMTITKDNTPHWGQMEIKQKHIHEALIPCMVHSRCC